jgi:hypothetical protein
MEVTGELHAQTTLLQRKGPQCPLDRRLGAAQNRRLREESFSTAGNWTPVMQPVVSHYTDWTTPANNNNSNNNKTVNNHWDLSSLGYANLNFALTVTTNVPRHWFNCMPLCVLCAPAKANGNFIFRSGHSAAAVAGHCRITTGGWLNPVSVYLSCWIYMHYLTHSRTAYLCILPYSHRPGNIQSSYAVKS